jgi:hypothetical protein
MVLTVHWANGLPQTMKSFVFWGCIIMSNIPSARHSAAKDCPLNMPHGCESTKESL